MVERDLRKVARQLADFRLRSEAMRELVAAGDEAVDVLAEELQSTRHEGARWSMIRCLGDIRSRRAVPALLPLLDDRSTRTQAQDALHQIAGQDLGPNPEVWRRWAGAGAGAAPQADAGAPVSPEHTTGHPDDRLMELAMEDTKGSCERAKEGRYVVRVDIGGGRTQSVNVRLDLRDHEGSALVIAYADCGPARPEDYEYALRRNFRMPYGALAVRETGGGLSFVMFNTLLREALSPVELRKSIFTVAERGAEVHEDLAKGKTTEPDTD